MRAHTFIYFLIKVTMIGLGFRLFSLIHHTAAHLEAEELKKKFGYLQEGSVVQRIVQTS